MFPAFVFVASALITIGCGIVLTRCADTVARLSRLGRLWVGSVLLAGATSLPELSVDLAAVRQDLPDVAIGGLLGSNLFNLLILAFLDLTHRSRGVMLSRISAAHALSGVMGILLVAIVALSILLSEYGSFGSIHLGTVAVFVAYLLGIRLIYQDQKISGRLDNDVARKNDQKWGRPQSLRQAIIGLALSAGVILLVGPVLAKSAGEIAEQTQLGNTFVGTTFVALTTSLPELVTTATALRIGAVDLALGNIFGSNALNVLLLAVVDLAYAKPLLATAQATHLITCLATIVATSVAVLGQLYHVESRKRFLEPDAWLVIGLVTSSLAALYFLRNVPL